MENMSPVKLIRLSKSCITDAEKRAVMDVLDREFLGMGDEVKNFEDSLGTFFGRPAVCVVNGTSALHLAVQACGIGLGDEVLVPSITYVASFQAISATGAKPVACDVDPETLTLDWRDAEKRLTQNTKAVMPVHYAGGVGDLDQIYALASKYGLRVIEDAAHAFGSYHKSHIVGGEYADIACFSFDGIKNITSGEGGCLVTNDSNVLRIARDARLLGVVKDTERRYSGQRSWEFDVTAQGWRYHMSNIMAAIGIEQLKRFPQLAYRRQYLARLYDSQLRSVQDIQLLPLNYDTVVPHIYVIRLSKHVNRDSLRQALLDHGIQTGVHYMPNNRLSLYKDDEALGTPVSLDAYPRLLTLPLHPDLSDEDVLYVCKHLVTFL